MSRRGKKQGPDEASRREQRREDIARRKHRSDDSAPERTGWWSSKWPILKPVMIFAGVMLGYYSIDFFVPQEVFVGYLRAIAAVSAGVLKFYSEDVAVSTGDPTIILSPMFSVRIVRGCDALEPTAAFVAAVVASPVVWRRKLPGLAIGIPALLLINIVRVVSLFIIGVKWPNIFQRVHYEVWQAAFIVLAVVFWALWVQWATRERDSKSSEPDANPS